MTVIAIFNALLRLAEMDTGARRSGFVQVNATELGSDAVEFYRPAAELTAVTLIFRAAQPVLVSGDPLLLAQAVGKRFRASRSAVPESHRIPVCRESR